MRRRDSSAHREVRDDTFAQSESLRRKYRRNSEQPRSWKGCGESRKKHRPWRGCMQHGETEKLFPKALRARVWGNLIVGGILTERPILGGIPKAFGWSIPLALRTALGRAKLFSLVLCLSRSTSFEKVPAALPFKPGNRN